MFILDDLFVSNEVLDFLEESREPVFNNDAARTWMARGRKLAIAAGPATPQTRVLSLTELELEHASGWMAEGTRKAIALCKDKATLRQALAPLYPDYEFRAVGLEELRALDPARVNLPVVVKPATGFFSLGIYPIFSIADWSAMLADVEAHSADWSGHYNESVINDQRFLIESYLDGQEYALDAYFDADGQAVVVDILQHDFAGVDDTSDRLYYTSAQLIREQLEPMTRFLNECNELLGFRNFALHPEVRVLADGRIVPIEFNPCRFAGLCNTDVAYFAYGFKTYEYFLHGLRPDWDALLEGKDDFTYAMIVLTTSDVTPGQTYRFDFDGALAGLSRVLSVRPTDAGRLNSFGFAFAEVTNATWDAEMTPLLADDLRGYLTLE